ncbi:MAG: aspartate/glutamate racemase family protein [Anaerolineaceae bacterium]|nr:MAG: aspartate/glutamate racemase family protein [Anaerolineaceae bacterium]
MKTIGLIGGMSWESSAVYYALINRMVRERLGGYHSAACVMVSVDFAAIQAHQARGEWTQAGEKLASAAGALHRAGADCVVLCTNTMHKVADAVQSAAPIPFIHIADATAQAIQHAGLSRVGLLGTRFTMDEDFYKGRLTATHGLTVLLPEADGREMVNRVIFDELVHGVIREGSRRDYLTQIDALAERGAEGVILGCTEIGLLVKAEHTALPLFDTTAIHAGAAVDFALG